MFFAKFFNPLCTASIKNELHGMKFKINLIPFNSAPGSKYQSPSMEQSRNFQKYLLDHGVVAPIRISKGQDIQGACGQLVVGIKA